MITLTIQSACQRKIVLNKGNIGKEFHGLTQFYVQVAQLLAAG
ncbi:hypothetical protein ALTERO38_60778 [Alteromonas sp. 38]|nr:hypothetical protein ALTER154_40017 [Alteromonas sp. 154]VXC33186.1 hypothetical protein ALTERO38_60778 [Alteromonas sp. 38]